MRKSFHFSDFHFNFQAIKPLHLFIAAGAAVFGSFAASYFFFVRPKNRAIEEKDKRISELTTEASQTERGHNRQVQELTSELSSRAEKTEEYDRLNSLGLLEQFKYFKNISSELGPERTQAVVLVSRAYIANPNESLEELLQELLSPTPDSEAAKDDIIGRWLTINSGAIDSKTELNLRSLTELPKFAGPKVKNSIIKTCLIISSIGSFSQNMNFIYIFTA